MSEPTTSHSAVRKLESLSPSHGAELLTHLPAEDSAEALCQLDPLWADAFLRRCIPT